jgi:hypothetical protein
MNAPAKSTILFTTLHDSQAGQIREMHRSDLKTVYHFNGLYRGHRAANEISADQFAKDTAKLTARIKGVDAKVLVFGVIDHDIDFSTLLVAQRMLEITPIETVILGSVMQRGGDIVALNIFAATRTGLRHVRQYWHLGKDAVWRTVIREAGEIRDRADGMAQAA